MVVYDRYKEYHYSWLRSSQVANRVENSSTGSGNLKIRNRESPCLIPSKQSKVRTMLHILSHIRRGRSTGDDRLIFPTSLRVREPHPSVLFTNPAREVFQISPLASKVIEPLNRQAPFPAGKGGGIGRPSPHNPR